MNFRNLVVQPASTGKVWQVQTLDLLTLALNRGIIGALGLTEGSFGMAEQELSDGDGQNDARFEYRLRFDLAQGDTMLRYGWSRQMNSAEMVETAIRNVAVRSDSMYTKLMSDEGQRVPVGIYGLPWKRMTMIAMVLEGDQSRLLLSCGVADADRSKRIALMVTTAYLIGRIYRPSGDQKMAQSVEQIYTKQMRCWPDAVIGELVKLVDKILVRFRY